LIIGCTLLPKAWRKSRVQLRASHVQQWIEQPLSLGAADENPLIAADGKAFAHCPA
jgi:hypothetical protein